MMLSVSTFVRSIVCIITQNYYNFNATTCIYSNNQPIRNISHEYMDDHGMFELYVVAPGCIFVKCDYGLCPPSLATCILASLMSSDPYF